jgi:hypothetical protein
MGHTYDVDGQKFIVSEAFFSTEKPLTAKTDEEFVEGLVDLLWQQARAKSRKHSMTGISDYVAEAKHRGKEHLLRRAADLFKAQAQKSLYEKGFP